MDLLLTLFSWLIALGIGLLLAMYCLLPLLVWKQQGAAADFTLQQLPAGLFLAERNAEFRDWHAALLGLDFEYLGSSQLGFSHATTFVSLYRHSNGLTGTVATVGNAQMEANMLEFTQLYADGSVLSVNNSNQVSVYPRLAYKRSYRLPSIRDARVLMKIALKHREPYNSPRSTLTPGKEFEEVGAWLQREQEDLIRMGYMQTGLRADGLRGLTLKAAYFMSWKLLWPCKGLLDAKQRRDGLALVRAA